MAVVIAWRSKKTAVRPLPVGYGNPGTYILSPTSITDGGYGSFVKVCEVTLQTKPFCGAEFT